MFLYTLTTTQIWFDCKYECGHGYYVYMRMYIYICVYIYVCVSIHVCILNAICANNCKYIEIWNRNVCIRHDHYYSCIHKMIHMTCHPSPPNAVFRVAQLLTFIAGLVKSEACSIHHLHKGLHIEAFQVHVSRVVLGGHGLVEIRDKTGEKRRLLCRVYMCSFAIVCVFCSSFTTIFIYMWSYIICGFYMFLSGCELGCVFRHLFHTFSRKQMQTLGHGVDESSGAGLTNPQVTSHSFGQLSIWFTSKKSGQVPLPTTI